MKSDFYQRTEEKQQNIDWHSGFAGGLGLSLRAYRNSIVIEREHPLSKEPLRIDFIVIKTDPNVKITNALGRLFRTYNILEYKNPGGELSMDVLWKCIGYAGLYKGLSDTRGAIPADELTVTILRYRKPVKLFGALTEAGHTISNAEPGIYRIEGVVALSLHIVVIRELIDDELLALKIMSDHADEADVKRFLLQTRYYSVPGDRHDADAVLQVSGSANRELFDRLRKEAAMCKALKEILSEEIAEEREEGRAEGRAEGFAEGEQNTTIAAIRNIMSAFGISVEKAMDSLKVPQEKRATYMSML